MAYLGALPGKLGTLMSAQMFQAPSDAWVFFQSVGLGWIGPVWAGFVACIGFVVWRWVVATRIRRFWALGMLLSLLPVCGSFPMDRLLLFSGVGFLRCLRRHGGFLSRGEREKQGRRFCGGAVVDSCSFGRHLVPIKLTGALHVLNAVKAFSVVDLPHERLDERQLVALDSLIWHMRCFRWLGIWRGSQSREADISWRRCRTPFLSNDWISDIAAEQPRRFLGGKLDQLTRGPQHPFSKGYRRECGLYEIQVAEVTPDGRPKKVQFQFDRDLDSRDLLWVGLIDGAFREWSPPRIGESERVDAPSLTELGSLIWRPQKELLVR